MIKFIDNREKVNGKQLSKNLFCETDTQLHFYQAFINRKFNRLLKHFIITLSLN